MSGDQPLPVATDAAPVVSRTPPEDGFGMQQRPNVAPMNLEMAVDAGIPLGCYRLSMTFLTRSQVIGLLLAGIFPLLKSLYGLKRRHGLDPVSVVIFLGLLLGLAAFLLGGGPKLLLLRESLFTGAFGLACLISIVFRSRRPLMFFFARFFAAGVDPPRRARFDRLWQYPHFRHAQRIITLVWGLVLLGEFTLRVVLIYALSTARVLTVSPIALGALSLLTVAWTFGYAVRARKAGAAVRVNSPTAEP